MGRTRTEDRDGEYVLCPLFVAFSDYEIRCKAHIPDANAAIQRYADRERCKLQKEQYCQGCWQRCEHYLSWKHFAWEDE